jgi:four helix bundle protein
MEDRVMQFEDLEAWKLARLMVGNVYRLTGCDGLSRDFGLKDQIQRASVSVMSNLAEGFERVSVNEKRHFYSISRASCGETRSLLYVIGDLFPAQAGDTQTLRGIATKVAKMISGLIKANENRKN